MFDKTRTHTRRGEINISPRRHNNSWGWGWGGSEANNASRMTCSVRNDDMLASLDKAEMHSKPWTTTLKRSHWPTRPRRL